LTLVQSGVYDINFNKLELCFSFFVGLCSKVYIFPNFNELVELLTKFVLTCSLDTDSDDFLLVFDDIKVNKGLKSEVLITNLQVLAHNLADIVPMVGVKVRVSQGIHDWHGSCECINTLLQLHLDVVGRQNLADSSADFCVFFALLGDLVSCYIAEGCLNPFLQERVPLLHRMPK